MKREICEKCVHYIQHYALGNISGVYKVGCGHCSHLLTNMTKKSCEFFEEVDKSKEKQELELLREVYRLKNNAQYIIDRLKLVKSMILELRKLENEKKHK